MSRTIWSLLLLTMFGLGFATSAWAGAELRISDDASLDLGIRIQPLAIWGDSDVDGDGEWDTYTDYKLRRARFRLRAKAGQYVEGFIQTEIGSGDGGSGKDGRVIDAMVILKPHQWFHFYTGLNMVPAWRQNLTSSGALMAVDRPGVVYKNLSWGNRAVTRMANQTLSGTDSGLRGSNDVRDEGITLFGSGALGETDASLKYYLGIYDGINAPDAHNDRFAGRVQVNFFDREPGYYNLSTYLGKKKTVGIGAAFDMQNAVARTFTGDPNVAGDPIDYSMFTFDGFVEYPLSDFTLTAEGAWSTLDLGDAMADVGGSERNWNAVQGSGYYVQAGLLVAERWQPWAEFEQWASDDDNDVGNYTAFRVGINYYIQGHAANLKLGYENTSTDVPITGDEDSMNTVILGAYITY